VQKVRARTSLCRNYSSAPSGLIIYHFSPTAYAVGYILAPLRG
jgi:hypothetical protein